MAISMFRCTSGCMMASRARRAGSFLALATSEGFEIHFHPCKTAYVVGDRTRLTQVMTNFVSNAVKYSGDNKYIDIKLGKGGRKVALAAGDTAGQADHIGLICKHANPLQ